MDFSAIKLTEMPGDDRPIHQRGGAVKVLVAPASCSLQHHRE